MRETLQEYFRRGGFLRIYPSKNSNIYDKFFGPSTNTPATGQGASSFGQNQGSQTQNSASSSGMSASRISNKVLHRLLYSDDLASYPNSSLIRKFSKTFSKYQVLSSTPQADEGILAPQDKTAGPSSILRDPQSSNQRTAAGGANMGYADDGGHDPGTPFKTKDG